MKLLQSSRARNLALLSAAAVALTLFAVDPAFAGGSTSFNANGKTLGTVASNLTTSMKGFGPLITMACYLGALVFGFIGAMKWKAYGEQPERTPLKIPIVYWGIAVLLAGFPEFMGTGITSLWGTGASLVNEP